jgi:glucose-6-phosphate 1-dehydrogenase
MQPLLDAPPDVQGYQPGSWGPAAANDLIAGAGGWREPWTVN